MKEEIKQRRARVIREFMERNKKRRELEAKKQKAVVGENGFIAKSPKEKIV